jgi:hypothetical protein
VVTRSQIAVLLAAILLISGCSSALKVSSFPISPQEPIASAADVRIFQDLPQPAYVEVARLELRWGGVRDETKVRRDERIRRALQTEAARLGADAVVDLQFITESAGHRPDKWAQEPRRVTGVSATAVRLKPRA